MVNTSIRLLLNRLKWDELKTRPGFTLIETYLSFVLISCENIPPDIPPDTFEIISSTSVLLHGRRLELPDGVYRLGEEPHTVLRFVGPISPAWQERLQRAGVKILSWAPQFGALVRLPDTIKDADALTRELPFVAAAMPYRAEDCSRLIPPFSEEERRAAGLIDNLYDLICFSREDRARLDSELQAAGVEVLGRSSCKLRVRYFKDPRWLRDQVGVKLVDSARAPRLLKAAWSSDIGVPEPASTGDFTGRGQILAVADTGLDSGDPNQIHEDFTGRIRHIASWPINESWAPFVKEPGFDDGPADRNSGHGTHVAGLALGNGRLSDGLHVGVAPAAELVFQSIEQFTAIKSAHKATITTGYYLSGRPLDLRQLFLQAREFGARIHINAWGDPSHGSYTDDCFEADMFLQEHPDAVVLFAAGNEGADRDGNRTLDSGSLYAPASAKNVIAVGACEGGKAGVGLRSGWSTFDRSGTRFREAGERLDLISGEPERIALISSTGPTADGRIKPDLCAPGTNLAAPRSRAITGQGWGMASPMPHYMYFGGTSMATGVVGGAAALLREAWTAKLGGQSPSGASLKALLIIGCKSVLQRSDNTPEPRYVGGFGRVWLEACMPKLMPGRLELHDEKEPGLLTGEQRVYRFRMGSQGAFKAVLCWYDAPGEALVNDLDLCLIDSEGRRIWGNHPTGASGSPDRLNNVEMIDQPNLSLGEYRLEVTAFNVLAPPQPYALAIIFPEQIQGTGVPIESLAGIGKSYCARLNQVGIENLHELLAISESRLVEIIKMKGFPRDRLIANLALFRRLLDRPGLAIETSRDITLSRLAEATPPVGMDTAAWNSLRQDLLPFLALFDKAAAKRITLGDLFK